MGAYYKLTTSITSANQFYLELTQKFYKEKLVYLDLDTCLPGLFFRANIGQAFALYNYNCMFFGMYDVILSIDTETKTIMAKY